MIHKTLECPTHGHAPDMGAGCAYCANERTAQELAQLETKSARRARCGSSDDHGAHATPARPYWCAGNRDIVTAKNAPQCSWCDQDATTVLVDRDGSRDYACERDFAKWCGTYSYFVTLAPQTRLVTFG